MATSRARAKKVEQEKLKDINTITVTIQASEMNLQRLAAFLLFCEYLEPTYTSGETKPMPWENPDDPRFGQAPELEIDPEVVRRAIGLELVAAVERVGVERVKAFLAEFGATGLASIPPGSLQEALAALQGLK